MDHPGTGLLGSGGQVGLQLQRVKSGVRQGIQATLMLPDLLQQLRRGLVVELLQFSLDLGVEEYRIGRSHQRAQFGDPGFVAQYRLVGVEHVQKRLDGQQIELAKQRGVDLRARGEKRRSGVEHLLGRSGGLMDRLAVLAVAGLLLQSGQRLVQGLQVGQDQFG